MRVIVVPAGSSLPAEAIGAIASRTVPGPRGSTSALIRKGETVTPAHLTRLALLSAEFHLLVSESGDVHEDVAATRLARAVAGPGLRADVARHGQVVLRAARRGWLRVHSGQLERVNGCEGVLVFTAFGERAVEAGTVVAAAKAAPLLLAEAIVEAVEADAAEHGPVAEVLPFPHRRVALILTDRLRSTVRQRARAHLESKVAWYGSTLAPVLAVRGSAAAMAEAFSQARQEADVVLLAGAVSTDPLAPAFEGLAGAGGAVVQVGFPVDPGTACWLGCLGPVPVVGLASCELSGRFTAVDVLLPRLLLGEPAGPPLLRKLAEGGLLSDESRLPPYIRASSAPRPTAPAAVERVMGRSDTVPP